MMHKLKQSELEHSISSHIPHKVLMAVSNDIKMKKELEDGNYVIFQQGQRLFDNKPVFAFKVENGNFTIVSVFGDSNDISNLASKVWFYRFKNRKAIQALGEIKKLRIELDKIEDELRVQIKRDPYYKNKKMRKG